MRKKHYFLLMIIAVFILSFCALEKMNHTTDSSIKSQKNKSTSKTLYKNGVYEAKSKETAEGYYAKTKITISKGLISNVYFQIFDTFIFKSPDFNAKVANYEKLKELPFDENYWPTVYYNHIKYQEQSRNELAGIMKYKKLLISTQDLAKVDVISGATWSYYLFATTVSEALNKSK